MLLHLQPRHCPRAGGSAGAGLEGLPPAYRLLLYRAAQEGLTNIQRHAHAAQARLHLQRQGDQVVLTLDDDGLGPPETPSPNAGWGLRGMVERAARLGGTARLLPGPTGGARLEVHLPWPEEAP